MSDIQCILHRNPAECCNSAAAPSVNIQDVLKDIWVLIWILSNIDSMVSVSFNIVNPIFWTSRYTMHASSGVLQRGSSAIGWCTGCIKTTWVLILLLSNIQSMVWMSFDIIQPICQTASIYSTGIWWSATTRWLHHRSMHRMDLRISGYSYQCYPTLTTWYQWVLT